MDSNYQTGLYTKIGNIVTVQAYLIPTSESFGDSETVRISGLPFTSVNLNSGYAAITVGLIQSFASSQYISIGGYVNKNTTEIQLTRMMDIVSGSSSLRTDEITENGQVIFQCTYRAA